MANVKSFIQNAKSFVNNELNIISKNVATQLQTDSDPENIAAEFFKMFIEYSTGFYHTKSIIERIIWSIGFWSIAFTALHAIYIVFVFIAFGIAAGCDILVNII